MNEGGGSLRTIGFPVRLGEWTLWAPSRTLATRRAGVLEVERERWPSVRDLPKGVDGFMLVRRSNRVPERRWPVTVSGGLIRWTMQRGPRYFIRLEGTFEDYLARFSAKTRSGLRRKLRRIESDVDCDVSFRVYAGDEFLAFHEAARAVSRSTYQEIMFDAGFPEDEPSKQQMAEAMAAGRAKGYMLFIGSEPVAYLYCPIRNGVAEYEFVGYRPDFAGLSPGTVLLLRVLESLFDGGVVRAFDFTEGAGQGSHKSFYATDSESFETVALLRPSAANIGLVLLRESVERVSSGVGYILDALGAKRRVRAWLRKARGVPA